MPTRFEGAYAAVQAIPGADTREPLTTPILIAAATAEKLIKASGGRSARTIPVLATVLVAQADGHPYAAVTDLTAPMVAALPNDQTFPNYECVIPPTDRPALHLMLGVPILEALIKSAKAAEAKGISFAIPTEPCHFSPATETTPPQLTSACTVTLHGPTVDVFGVVMPMRN